MQEEKVIMYDSPEAAEKTTLTGWVSKGTQRYWHQNEHMARWSGCTHLKCDCGRIMTKAYLLCEKCRAKKDRERYLALPYKEWDGIAAVCLAAGDKYFFDLESLEDYMSENEDEPLTEVDLLFCEENSWQKVQNDYWEDYTPEDDDGALPKELQEALTNLNAVIDKLPPQSYSPSKIRTSHKLTP